MQPIIIRRLGQTARAALLNVLIGNQQERHCYGTARDMHRDGVPAACMPVRPHLHLNVRSIGDLWRLERIGKAVGYGENVTIKKKQGFPRRYSPESPTPLSAWASDARQFEPSSDFAGPPGRPQGSCTRPGWPGDARPDCAIPEPGSRRREEPAQQTPLASFRIRAGQFPPPPSRSRMASSSAEITAWPSR